MELEHYNFNAGALSWYMNSCLKNFRKDQIKFYFRLLKISTRFNLSLDEMYTIYLRYWGSMTNRQFWNFFINDESFRTKAISRITKL